jgi:hypothetical protein
MVNTHKQARSREEIFFVLPFTAAGQYKREDARQDGWEQSKARQERNQRGKSDPNAPNLEIESY